MANKYINRLAFLVTNSPGSGGDVAVGAAASNAYRGSRTLGAADDGAMLDVRFEQASGGWEQRVGCTYTHMTSTLTRGVLVDSSTGSAINLSAGDIGANDVHASMAQRLDSQANPRRFVRILAIGSSITNMWGDTGAASYSRSTSAGSYLHWLSVAMAGRVASIINKGVSGDTTTQMLSRFSADVVANYSLFDTLLVEPGPNDYSNNLTAIAIKSNISSMVASALVAGKDVVILSPTVSESWTSAQYAVFDVVRKWIFDTYYGERGVILIDAASLLSDPLTGNPLPEMYLPTSVEAIRTHPSIAGACVLGRAIAAALGDGPKAQPILPMGSRDPNELVPNARVQGNNASGARNFYAGAGVTVVGGPDSSEIGISRGSFATVSIAPVTPSGAGAPGSAGSRITISNAASDRSAVSMRIGSSDGVYAATQYGRWDGSFTGGAAYGYGSHFSIGGAGIFTCIVPGTAGGSVPSAPSTFGELVVSGSATFMWQKLPSAGDVVVPELEYEIESMSGSVGLVVSGVLCRTADGTSGETYGWGIVGNFDQSAALSNGSPSKWLPRSGVISGLPITLQSPGVGLRHVYVELGIVCMAGASITLVVKRAGMRLK